MLQLIVRKYRWFILLCFLFALTTFNLNNSNFFNLFFKVENVQYNKTLFVEESLKSEAMDLLINKNLFLLDKKKIIDLFYQSPWVEKVEFKKKLPNQLYINITEYFPVAYFKENNQLYLVNNNYKNTLVSDDINTDDNVTTNVVEDDSSKQKASGWGSYFASRAPSSVVQRESTTDKDKIADAVKSNTHTIEDKLLISKYRSSYEQTIIELEGNVSYALLSAVINNAEMISNNPTSSNSQTMINSINNLKTFRQTLNDAMKILDSK